MIPFGPELQCFSSLLHFPGGFGVWTLLSTYSGRPHSIWTFQILWICKTYCNQISIWPWHNTSLHPFVKWFWTTEVKTTTPRFIKLPFLYIIFGCIETKINFQDLETEINFSKFYGKTPQNNSSSQNLSIENNLIIFLNRFHEKILGFFQGALEIPYYVLTGTICKSKKK